MAQTCARAPTYVFMFYRLKAARVHSFVFAVVRIGEYTQLSLFSFAWTFTSFWHFRIQSNKNFFFFPFPQLQEYHKNSPRIKLDVAIQAPLVIVPVSSQSKRVLVADLGNLEVHNDFSVVQKGVGPDIVVVDNMVVSFTSLQVSV